MDIADAIGHGLCYRCKRTVVWVEVAGRLNARGHWVSGRIVLRPQRTLNYGRVFLALTYFLISVSFPDQVSDFGERAELFTLALYLLLALAGTAIAARSWFAEAALRLPLLALDALAFVVLITYSGGSSSPYRAAFVLLVIVAALNLPKIPKLIVPALAVIGYLIVIGLGLAGNTAPESRSESIALNVVHMLLLGTFAAVFLEGGWRRNVQGDARQRLGTADIFEASYSLLELAVAGTKKAIGAQRAHLFIMNIGEYAAYLAKAGEPTLRLDADSNAIANMLTLPPHSSLVQVKGDRGYRLSQPPSRAYGPQLERLPPAVIDACKSFGVNEAVLLPVQILDNIGYLLLEFDEPLTEAHMLRAAQSRHRITQMVENYERRLAALAMAKERERQALWRNLHDGTVQSLAAVQFHLGRLTGSPGTTPETRSALEVVESIVAGEAHRLRAMSAHQSDPVDCAKLLKQTAKDLGRKWQIDCGFSQSTNVATALVAMNDEGTSIAQGLAFAMEEMVANGVRHGKASKITFKLSATKYALTLRVHGNGSPPTSAQALPKSLSERVTEMDGQLTIEAETGGFGMQIVIKNRGYANG
jgi:signal transduction histidine kinase